MVWFTDRKNSMWQLVSDCASSGDFCIFVAFYSIEVIVISISHNCLIQLVSKCLTAEYNTVHSTSKQTFFSNK